MSNTSLLGSFGGQAGDALMFRNLIINGNFDIWQRGTSAPSTTASAGTYASADRWKFSGFEAGVTYGAGVLSQVTSSLPSGSRYAAQIGSSTAGTDSLIMAQYIESANAYQTVGQKVTVSLKLKRLAIYTSDVPIVIELRSLDAQDTGGNPINTMAGTTLIQSYSHTPVGSDWETVTFTTSAVLSSAAANGLALVISWSKNNMGVGNAFAVAQVQLEAGPTATPFERRPIGQELALAQRYCYVQTAATCPAAYKRFALGFAASTNTSCQLVFLPSMRVPPTPTFSAPSTFVLFDGTNITVLNSILVDTSLSEVLHINCGTSGTLAANRPYMLLANNNNTAYIIYSAEL